MNAVREGSRIGLLDAEPELGRFLTREEQEQAGRVLLGATELRGPFDELKLLQDAGAFAGIIVTGMIMHYSQIGEQRVLRLLGPGNLLSAADGEAPILGRWMCIAVAETRVAMLDDRMLVAAQRWPRLVSALHLRSAEQAQQVAAQLAICQLPRVADRLLALMWMLAETWGHVTPSGVTLPVAITHDALGAMIGARRSTVTLALGELADSGAVVKQEPGWLLVERPAVAAADAAVPEAPVLFESTSPVWAAPTVAAPTHTQTHQELMELVARLSAEHSRNRERMRQRLDQVRLTRDRVRQRRAELTGPNRRRAPSS